MNVEIQDDASRVSEALDIDEFTLKAEFIRLPADMGYWNARYAEALRLHLRMKHACEMCWAGLDLEYREKQLEVGAKKLTEKGLESSIESDARYIEAKSAEVEAESERWRMRGIVDSLSAKRDMLMSLGAYVRQEMQDPLIRDQYTSGPAQNRRT